MHTSVIWRTTSSRRRNFPSKRGARSKASIWKKLRGKISIFVGDSDMGLGLALRFVDLERRGFFSGSVGWAGDVGSATRLSRWVRSRFFTVPRKQKESNGEDDESDCGKDMPHGWISRICDAGPFHGRLDHFLFKTSHILRCSIFSCLQSLNLRTFIGWLMINGTKWKYNKMKWGEVKLNESKIPLDI